jgi:hypothetical protein
MSAREAAEWVLSEVGLALTRVVDDAGWQDTIDDPALFSRRRFWAVAAALAPMAAARLARLRGEPVPSTPGRISDFLLRELGEESVLGRAFAEAAASSGELAGFDASQIDLGEVHEFVLGRGFGVRGGQVRWEGCDAGLHQLGSYYTPASLADAAVEQIVHEWLDGRSSVDLVGARVVDLSCGAGRFLVAWVRHVRARLPSVRGAEAFAALAGVDVDPVALDLARVEIAVAAGDASLASVLSGRFRLGNPLLQASGARASTAERVTAIANGYPWDPSLALDDAGGPWDMVVGNPPWEKIRLEERAFFKHLAPAIAACTRKDERGARIESELSTRPLLRAHLNHASSTFAFARSQIASDPRLKPAAAHELNSYALFVALGVDALAPGGTLGLLVKSALVTAPANQRLFAYLVDRGHLRVVWDFVNSRRLFDIDSRERFALVVCGQPRAEASFRFAMGLEHVEQLKELSRLQEASPASLREINPLTGMLPNVSDDGTMARFRRVARAHPTFDEVYRGARFGRIVHLTTHADFIRRAPGPDLLPILEGKFIEQYDARFSGFRGVSEAMRYTSKARALVIPESEKGAECVPEARFFITAAVWAKLSARYPDAWSLVWRNTTSATNRRTCIATILPHVPGIQSIQIIQFSDRRQLALLLATMNSLPFDAMLRARLNGIDLTQKFVRQVPVPDPQRWEECVSFGGVQRALSDHVLARVRVLLVDDARLVPFVEGFPAGSAVASRAARRPIMRELDLLLAYAYGIEGKELYEMAAGFESDLTKQERQRFLEPDAFPCP